MDLKKYNVTVRRFDPQQGVETGEDFVLPVNSPDEEHAACVNDVERDFFFDENKRLESFARCLLLRQNRRKRII